MRRVGQSRAELLQTLERPALKALPSEPYAYAEWKRARVAPDYHIEIAGHFYSVLQAEMFREAASAGGLDVQLVYYRGTTECQASQWVSHAERLASLMERIDCRAGHTQIGKVVAHARRESEKTKVAALVFVGDAMEEKLDDLLRIPAKADRDSDRCRTAVRLKPDSSPTMPDSTSRRLWS